MKQNGSNVSLWTRDFIFIAAINFLIFSSWQTLPFVLPVYLQSLGAPDAALGWVTAITTGSALLIRPFCGALLDRFGRKGILLSGILFMVVVTTSFAFFPFVGVILALRFIHGLSWGITSTSSQTVASDIIPPRRFGEGMGLFALSASLAMAIAPGLALELFNGQGILPVIVLGVGALACAFVFACFLKYRKIEKRTEFSIKGLLEKSSLAPTAIMVVLSACYGALVTFLAIHAAAQGVQNIGLFFTAYAIAVALSRPIMGKFVDRKGYKAVLVPGLLLMIAGLVLLSQANSLPLFILTAFVYASGFAACNSTLQTMAVSSVEPQRRGAANATFLIGFDGGIGLGSIVSGLLASMFGYSGMYLCFAAFPLIGGIIFFLFARNRKPPSLMMEAEGTSAQKS